MNNHAGEEDRVKPRERRLEPSDQAPRKGKEDITSVMNLPCFTVPSVRKNLGSSFRGNGLWVCEATVLEVRERSSLVDNTTLLLTELVLLRVRRVPDIVDAQVGDGQECGKPNWPLVLGGVVEWQRRGCSGSRRAGRQPCSRR